MPRAGSPTQLKIHPSVAPPGKHILSLFVQYAPYRLAESTWDTERAVFTDRVLRTLAEWAIPVRVPGTVRLVVELVVLLGGAAAVTWAGETVFGVVLAVLVVFHYATTMSRVTWLVAQ